MANHRAPKRSASRTGTTNGSDQAARSAAPVSSAGKRKAVKPSRSARTLSRRSQTSPRPEATPAPVTPPTPIAAPAPIAPPAPVVARHLEPPVSSAAPRRPVESERPTEVIRPAAAPVPPRATASGARRAAPPPRRAAAPSRGSAPEARRSAAAAPKRPAARRSAPPADTRATGRKGGFPLLPSAPTLVGAAALVIAAAGALTVADSSEQLAAAGSTKMFTPASALTGTDAGMSRGALDDRLRAVSRDSQRSALEDAADDDLQAAVEAQAQERNAALAQLAASAEKYAGQIAANAWHLPVAPGLYHLTAGFGESSGLWAHTHTGLDFAAPTGTPVMSVAKGTVRSAGWAGAYGNRIVIAHQDGTETWYCHLSAFQASVGQSVVGGQQIGLVGSTGNVTGPHLHLEVRPGAGDPVDPYAALVAHGIKP